MKSIIKYLIVLLTLMICTLSYADYFNMTDIWPNRLKEDAKSVGVAKFTASDYKPEIIKHIVLFKFAKSVTEAEKNTVKQKFLALKNNSLRHGKPYIVSIEAGNNSSGEGLAQGFEQAFIITFKSEGDRNYYVGQPIVTDAKFYDPVHQAFKEMVIPLLAKDRGALVFDFVVE